LLATCSAEVAGLGEGDLVVTTSVSVGAQYQCQNKGGTIAPGQNRVLSAPVTSTVTIPSADIENGRVTINGSTTTSPQPAATVSGSTAGCPNGNWTGVNPTITDATVLFRAVQGGVTLFSCTGTTPATGGSVSLTCTGVAR
jgi:hypothetical protein